MKKSEQLIMMLMAFMVLLSCKKGDFLDKKPLTELVVANSLTDFSNLLENTSILRSTGGLSQISSDDYTILTSAEWQSLSSSTQRNSYIWNKEIYGGDNNIQDWNALYKSVFYANAVLDGLSHSEDAESDQGKYIKARALFVRAYAFYDLVRNFCEPYDEASATINLGIPIRLRSAIEYSEQRASLQQSFDQILKDLFAAEPLLPVNRPSANLNRPSKIAVYALLARIYLDMRNYVQAEIFADKCLAIYSTLIDYNGINKTVANPFTNVNDELIYNSVQVTSYSELAGTYTSSVSKILPSLIDLYDPNDLRLSIYFAYNPITKTYTKKGGYYGIGSYPFTGLATDEVYLIKAECLARRNETGLSMEKLNLLLIKRFTNTSTNPFVGLKATSPLDALDKILIERRKELVWRGLRWHDLKRLNKEGADITLSRILNGITYLLPPNDPRWVFPIPDDEIALSGIEQNKR